MPTRFACPACSGKMAAPRKKIGELVVCPHCAVQVEVPDKAQLRRLRQAERAIISEPLDDGFWEEIRDLPTSGLGMAIRSLRRDITNDPLLRPLARFAGSLWLVILLCCLSLALLGIYAIGSRNPAYPAAALGGVLIAAGMARSLYLRRNDAYWNLGEAALSVLVWFSAAVIVYQRNAAEIQAGAPGWEQALLKVLGGAAMAIILLALSLRTGFFRVAAWVFIVMFVLYPVPEVLKLLQL